MISNTDYKFTSCAAKHAWGVFTAQSSGAMRIQPGTQGWWKVWGARVRDIKPGDLVVSKTDDGEYEVDLIEDVYTPKNHPLRWGFIIAGERVTMGALHSVIVLRQALHNILAESVR